jgi:hypothetical protein
MARRATPLAQGSGLSERRRVIIRPAVVRRLINQVVLGSPCPGCSPQRPYARRSALATFVRATSSVLRDVAIFIRIWPSPPNPYDVAALI